MDNDYPRKVVPGSIAVFGAGGRMGSHVANYLRYAAPHVALRLLASSPAGLDTLRERFPGADIRVANYLQPETLGPALADMEGVFVVTASGVDEKEAMTNFVEAAQRSGSARHIVRIMGYAPDSHADQVPAHFVEMGGDCDQHYTAKEVLRHSGLPITYLNLGASLMDNLLFTSTAVKRSRTLIWPQRSVPMMDGRDVGEVAARLLMHDDARHVGQFHTINNGYDYPTTGDVAQIMSDAFQTRIVHDSSWEAFDAEYGAMLNGRQGRVTESSYRYQYFNWEYRNWMWSLNDFSERLLGRRPNMLRSWLLEHKEYFV